ncbi:hypothetical protein Tco_0627423 [Tanacetum coccineum]|uniref:Uncharacterized protein n=1 Tax=Tanacetum coccineum TaxID=301880 RepID=A0ABQ4WN74_9ASTR
MALLVLYVLPQCGVIFINGICLNCTYGDGKPVTCCGCEGPLNGGFCSFCASRAGNSFAYDPNPNSFDDSQNLSDYPPQPQYQTYSYELCGNDAHFGYDCPPQVLFVYNPDPCFNQNYDNNFPQTSSSFPQQYLCCENCGGPHETFQCQPMNQNFYNSSGFDQFQPPQYPVIHHPPQETSKEILQAREDLMKSIQTFLKKFNHISFRETPKVLSLAWEKFFEIQHAQPEDIQELLHKLLKDLQIIREELAEYINSLSWNRPAFYDDDDDEYTIQYREILGEFCQVITPVLTIKELLINSLSMGDEHLSTIPEMESDEVTKSSVEDLVPILKDIECKDSYGSNLDESTFLVTPLSDSNRDECFTLSDNVELLLHHDRSISVVSIIEGFTDEPPLEKNDDLFDLESKENDWKKILYDAPIDDLIIEDQFFDPEIHEIIFSPTYGMAYEMSSGSCSSTLFRSSLSRYIEDCSDYEDSRARCFVHRSLDLRSLARLYMGIRYPRSYRLTFIF